MKTNTFNESIRRKLEQIQPDRGPDAWERFQAHRQSPSMPIWKSVWAKAAMLFMALGAAAGGVHLVHVRETKQLKETVQHLTRQRDSLLAKETLRPNASLLTPPSDTNSKVAQVPESLAIASNQGPAVVTVPENGRIDESSPVRKIAEAGTPTSTPAHEASPQAMERKYPSAQQVKTSFPRKQVEVPRTRAQLEETSSKRMATRITPRSERTYEAPDRSESVSTRQRSTPADVGSSIPGNFESPISAPEGSEPIEGPERTVITGLAPLSPRHVVFDSLPRTTRPVIFYYEAPKQALPVRRTLSPFPIQLTGRLGIAGRMGAGQRSVQATGEVGLGERIGVQLGLQSGFVAGARYATEQEFQRTTRRDFRHQHDPKLPPRFHVLNITETYSVLSLPIRVNYYQPLGSSWWGVFATGTDLDISVRHQVQYDIYDFRSRPSEFARRENGASVSTQTFTNLTVSMGVEKRFGRVGLQVLSSWALPVTLPEYRRSVAVWSGQFGLTYQIGNRARRFIRPLSPPS